MKKTSKNKLIDRDMAQEAWEREMFLKPLAQWTSADRFRYWIQPKRLKIQMIFGAIVMIPSIGYFFWQVYWS